MERRAVPARAGLSSTWPRGTCFLTRVFRDQALGLARLHRGRGGGGSQDPLAGLCPTPLLAVGYAVPSAPSGRSSFTLGQMVWPEDHSDIVTAGGGLGPTPRGDEAALWRVRLSPGWNVRPTGRLSHGGQPAVPTTLTPLLPGDKGGSGEGAAGAARQGLCRERAFSGGSPSREQLVVSWGCWACPPRLLGSSLAVGWPGKAGVCIGMSVRNPWGPRGLETVTVSLHPAPVGPARASARSRRFYAPLGPGRHKGDLL